MPGAFDVPGIFNVFGNFLFFGLISMLHPADD
jgi:hypothetical protein